MRRYNMFRCLSNSEESRATTEGKGTKDASIQKLLGLQRWPRHRLGGCSFTRTDDRGQRESEDLPVGLSRLLYRLGVDDNRPVRLSAAKVLGVESPSRLTSLTTSWL